jgi:5,10-methylene-tetrahydrofolate dehydrogenase/methenyl tetrahydrofolate cyclohydrolase
MAHFKAKIEEDIRKNIRSKNTKQQTNGYNSPKLLICQANKNPVQAGGHLMNNQSQTCRRLPTVLRVGNDSSDSYRSGGIPSAMQ